MIKRNPKPPNVTITCPIQHLFAQGFSTAVKTARRRPKRKIRCIGFKPITPIGTPTRVSATAGDMPPRNTKFFAHLANPTWQHGVPHKAFSLMVLTSINIRFPSITGSINQKARPLNPHPITQHRSIRIVDFSSGKTTKLQISTGKYFSKLRTDVSGSSKNGYHKKRYKQLTDQPFLTTEKAFKQKISQVTTGVN
jgi:hypothetical protein